MSSRAAAALVFTTSAAVLVLEILAGRLLAPYAGVTLETFTAIIGTILAGISVGAWLGGRAADRHDPTRLIGPLIAAGGALSFAAVPLVDVLGPATSANGGINPVSLVVVTAIAFFTPAAVLSAIAPLVVKARLDDLDETGRIVGRLSAIGTAGAIVGTFVTGFVLVANLPTRPTVFGVAGGLVVLGVVLAITHRAARGTLSFVLALAAAGATTGMLVSSPCEHESPYFCAMIETDPDRESGRILRLDTLRHSYVDLDDPTYLDFSYARTLADVFAVEHPPPEPITAVHVGGGGFTFPQYLRATRPGTESIVLELDPLLVDLAVEELGFEPGPDIDVLTGDARLTLQLLAGDDADLVIGDAFGGVSVPWHLATLEFVELVHDKLRSGGTYTLNMIDYGPRDFARAEMATLAAVFEHVAAFAPAERFAPRNVAVGGNYILVASDEPIDVEAILTHNHDRGGHEAAVSTADGSLQDFVGDAIVLRDDHAPVDQLLTPLPTR